MKAFFFDYDGTLVDDQSKAYTQGTMDAIKELKRRGHLVILNTGRTKSILDKAIDAFPFDGMIMGCGTHIEFHGETLLNATIDPQHHEAINRLLEINEVDAFLEGEKYLYITKNIQHCFLRSLQQRYEKAQKLILPVTAPQKSYSKLFICYRDTSKKQLIQQATKAYVSYIERSEDCAELIALGYSKATGIQIIMEKMGLKKEDCYVFGDSTNDLPMFEFIPNSILIGNDNPELAKHVMLCSDASIEDGILKALRTLQIL